MYEDIYLKFPLIKQIVTQKCPFGTSFGYISIRFGDVYGSAAHTHVSYDIFNRILRDDPYTGIVCINDIHIYDLDGNPSVTIWHEYAHLLMEKRPKNDHGKEWQRKLVELGYPWIAAAGPTLPLDWVLNPPDVKWWEANKHYYKREWEKKSLWEKIVDRFRKAKNTNF
jgi:hypothetical protein